MPMETVFAGRVMGVGVTKVPVRIVSPARRDRPLRDKAPASQRREAKALRTSQAEPVRRWPSISMKPAAVGGVLGAPVGVTRGR